MNKKILWISLVIFTLTLTACSSTTKTNRISSRNKAPATALSTQTKLVLGTINLEGTDAMVTAEQATQLLPMFYVLQELNSSKSAAQEEVDGLVNQIQATLTKDQLQAIDGMSLSMRDVLAITQVNSKSSSKTSSTTTSSGAGAGRPPADMGGGMPSGGMSSTNTTSVSSASGTMPAMGTSTPSALFDAAIKLLKTKIQ
jgi:hypothetical protein